MFNTIQFRCAAALLFLAAIFSFGALAKAGPEGAMADAARKFLACLSPENRAKALFAFADAERLNWHFIPRERKGLPLKEMNEAERMAAAQLLRSSLSADGYETAETIRSLEKVLRFIEKSDRRDSELYFFSIFGAPGGAGHWGWRIEGHHLSLNWTIASGRLASTPQFFGANPAEVRVDAPGGPKRGTRALGPEEDLARALLDSLSEEQKKQAIVGTTAPADIFTAAEKTARRLDDSGVTYGSLTREQKGLMQNLVTHYARKAPDHVASDRLQKIIRSTPESIRFAWMGSTERGKGHYYRVQGPTFLIEYDNTQNDANHVHSVWRDFKGDFGADLLAMHYRSDPLHRRASVRVSPAARGE